MCDSLGMNKIIEEQLKFILSSCETFSKNACAAGPGVIDGYGFLVSIGSNLGKIKAEVEKLNNESYSLHKLIEAGHDAGSISKNAKLKELIEKKLEEEKYIKANDYGHGEYDEYLIATLEKFLQDILLK